MRKATFYQTSVKASALIAKGGYHEGEMFY